VTTVFSQPGAKTESARKALAGLDQQLLLTEPRF
jgi:hypothetical protein